MYIVTDKHKKCYINRNNQLVSKIDSSCMWKKRKAAINILNCAQRSHLLKNVVSNYVVKKIDDSFISDNKQVFVEISEINHFELKTKDFYPNQNSFYGNQILSLKHFFKNANTRRLYLLKLIDKANGKDRDYVHKIELNNYSEEDKLKLFNDYRNFRLQRRKLKDEYNELCLIEKYVKINDNCFDNIITEINDFYNRSYHERCDDKKWEELSEQLNDTIILDVNQQ